MQVLKKSIRARILTAATLELCEHGYEGTSIAMIADRSNVAVGNIYRYFKSKLEIFYAITTPVVDLLFSIVRTGRIPAFKDDARAVEFINEIDFMMRKVIKKYRRGLQILLRGSRGTAYAKTKARLISLLERRMLAMYKTQFETREVTIKEPFIAHIFAASVIEGYSQIIEHYKNDQWLDNISSDFVKYNITGYLAFFQ